MSMEYHIFGGVKEWAVQMDQIKIVNFLFLSKKIWYKRAFKYKPYFFSSM